MNKETKELLMAWEKINNEKSIWDNLRIENSSFYFEKDKEKIFLSSFKNSELPKSPYTLTLVGKILTKLSVFANVMSRRPGTEEVTFYSIMNEPQGMGLSKKIDKKILDVVAPPITWRRNEIHHIIKDIIKKYIFDYKQSFAFIDIGCGGGFDSLEIERIFQGMKDILKQDLLPSNYDILNIDIDTKWLDNNKKLTESLLGNTSRIKRHNMSIFDYLNNKLYIDEFLTQDNLIISCNGFAEFLSDEDLKKLYIGIRDLADSFSGKIHVILPFANKNKKQEELGNKIGFKFRAKEKSYMIDLIKETFNGYKVSFTEKYSQIVLLVEK